MTFMNVSFSNSTDKCSRDFTDIYTLCKEYFNESMKQYTFLFLYECMFCVFRTNSNSTVIAYNCLHDGYKILNKYFLGCCFFISTFIRTKEMGN